MVYRLDDILRDVRVCLDEDVVNVPMLASHDVDALSLDGIIRSKVLDAVQRVHLDAPYYLLEGGHNFGDAVYWGDLESGWVLLPDDWMRLVVFEMDDWDCAVYAVTGADDPEYVRQRSRIKGVRGTAQRPVCVLGVRPEGRVLEFYSCRSADACVRRAVYLPYPTLDAYGGIDVSRRCYRPVVYAAAGLSAMACGDMDRGNALLELSKSYLK